MSEFVRYFTMVIQWVVGPTYAHSSFIHLTTENSKKPTPDTLAYGALSVLFYYIKFTLYKLLLLFVIVVIALIMYLTLLCYHFFFLQPTMVKLKWGNHFTQAPPRTSWRYMVTRPFSFPRQKLGHVKRTGQRQRVTRFSCRSWRDGEHLSRRNRSI